MAILFATLTPMPNLLDTLLARVRGTALPDLPPDPRTAEMKAEPKPFDIQDKGYHPQMVKIDDPRPLPMTGKKHGLYNGEVIGDIVEMAKKYGIDPNIALATGLQETGLGSAPDRTMMGKLIPKAFEDNPMRVSAPIRKTYTPQANFDEQRLAGQVVDQISPQTREKIDRDAHLEASMGFMKHNFKRFGVTPHGIQAYNGLGRLDPAKVGPMMYGQPTQSLKKDFYGHHILDMLEQIIKPSSTLQKIVRGK